MRPMVDVDGDVRSLSLPARGHVKEQRLVCITPYLDRQ